MEYHFLIDADDTLWENNIYFELVGNSPRSDINPALAAGLNAIYIPHPHTWHLEHEEVQNTGEGQLLTLSAFADLRTHF